MHARGATRRAALLQRRCGVLQPPGACAPFTVGRRDEDGRRMMHAHGTSRRRPRGRRGHERLRNLRPPGAGMKTRMKAGPALPCGEFVEPAVAGGTALSPSRPSGFLAAEACTQGGGRDSLGGALAQPMLRPSRISAGPRTFYLRSSGGTGGGSSGPARENGKLGTGNGKLETGDGKGQSSRVARARRAM